MAAYAYSDRTNDRPKRNAHIYTLALGLFSSHILFGMMHVTPDSVLAPEGQLISLPEFSAAYSVDPNVVFWYSLL